MTKQEFFLQAIQNTFYVKRKEDVLDLLFLLIEHGYLSKTYESSFGYHHFTLLKDFNLHTGTRIKQYRLSDNPMYCDSLTISGDKMSKEELDRHINESNT